MPNDLYQWEGHGGLVHHCPECFKPLTTPQARSRCLGEHVEWCKSYHTQLFKKGTCGSCDPCRRSDEERIKRHREIAEDLLELRCLKMDLMTPSPLTPKHVNTLQQPPTPGPDTPIKKKERKAIKKAKKISEMPKVVSSQDIDFVAKALHAHSSDADDHEVERKLLEDPEIKLNRFFHKGTSNRREIRNEFVKKDRRGSKVEMHVEAENIDGFLQLLNVSPLTASSGAEEKMIHATLREKIEKDLIHAEHEREGYRMRKAGFWRWASKKAYNRLVENGRIWEKGGEVLAVKIDDTSSDTPTSADSSIDDQTTETDTDITKSSKDAALTTIASLSLKSPSSPATSKSLKHAEQAQADDGWTTVGKLKKVKSKTPVGKLRLTHNNGLHKLVQSPTSTRRGFANPYGMDP